MRKIISLGLFALTLSIFSSQVFAGNALDCEPLKQTKNKSLYGLCVAWHNADEQAKDKIAGKFLARAGFEVPGSVEGPEKFDCLCWNKLTFKEICELGQPTANANFPDRVAVTWVDFSTFTGELFGADTQACEYGVQDLITGEFDPFTHNSETRLGEEEAGICWSEVVEMFTLYLENCEEL